MSLTSIGPIDALRHDIMTHCGSDLHVVALQTLVNSGQNAALHKISSRNLCHKLLEKVSLGTVRPASGCWKWIGTLLPNGYAQIAIGGRRKEYIHRLVYTLTYGPIPEGLQLDHLCRNRACCRPDHLQAVSCRENLLRGETMAAKNAIKTACVNGHPYGDTNLYLEPYRARSGEVRYGRRCRTCRGLPQKEIAR
jgi:hypothetical protein